MIESETPVAANDDELVVECELPQAPEMVWRALTVPRLVAAWLLPNTMGEPKRGERFELDGSRHGLSERIACELLDAEPQRRLSYSWREADDTRSVVTFELTPAGAGTRLRVTHGAPLRQTLMAANGNAPPMMRAA